MSEGREPAGNRPVPTRRTDVLALLFVGLALFLVLVVPLLTERRTAGLRERLEHVAEPSRDAVTEVQYQLAREMSNLRAFLLTGDTMFLGRYTTIAGQQRETLRDLTRLAAGLGVDATDAAATLRDRVLRWQQSVTPQETVGSAPPGRGEILLDQRLYEEASRAAAAFDYSLGLLTRETRQEIRDVERVGILLTLSLAALAILAVAVLVWFGRRLRGLAAEARAGHLQAQEALEATRRAFEARDRLVRGVTHDVKNPLGAADGYAEILQLGLRGALSPEQATTVEGIRRSLRSALAIIEELLDLAQAERGRLPLSFRHVSLNETVERAAEAHRGTVEAAGQTLEISLPSEPLVARTDPNRVEQVLGNLLSNAAKYAGPGIVRVALDWESGPAGGSREWGALSVVDSGPGIPADHLDSIFTEFHRVDANDRRGHGVGLAMARHIARHLGGELTVRSEHGQGAAFTLRLPLDPGPGVGAVGSPETAAAPTARGR